MEKSIRFINKSYYVAHTNPYSNKMLNLHYFFGLNIPKLYHRIVNYISSTNNIKSFYIETNMLINNVRSLYDILFMIFYKLFYKLFSKHVLFRQSSKYIGSGYLYLFMELHVI